MMKKHPHKAYKIARKSSVKHSGNFQGKSNVLGHGGRAAQLKARGVPGGVIGMLARRAGAAPGQANYHGKKSKKRKVAPLQKQELGMAMKKSHKKKASAHVIHVHHHGSGHVHVHMKGSSKLTGQVQEHKELAGVKAEAHKKHKKAHKKGFGDEKEAGLKLEHREEGAKGFKKSRKRKGAAVNPNSPANYGKSMSSAFQGTKMFRKGTKKKVRHE